MSNLSKNIARHEVACRCGICGFDSMDVETVRVVQGACDHFARVLGLDRVVLTITSGARCLGYNRSDKVGSNDESQHPKARALDIRIAEVTPQELYNYLDTEYPDKYGIGLYYNFVHIDTRTNGPARW